MSIQSDAAKAHIEHLLAESYGKVILHLPRQDHQTSLNGDMLQDMSAAYKEYAFAFPERKWRMDYAVPGEKVAIEIDGGLFIKGAHANPAAIRANYEKLNTAASMGWRVWKYLPEQIIKAGRKIHEGFTRIIIRLLIVLRGCVTLPDEPILKQLPWTVR